MRRLCALLIVGVVSVTILVTTPAFAITNLFTPITGASFFPVLSTSNNLVRRVNGTVANPTTGLGNDLLLDASLGHAGGGNGNGFYVYGNNNGQFLSCAVRLISFDGSQSLGGGNSSTMVTGAFVMFVPTTAPTGDFYYGITCSLPPANSAGMATLFGVKPDH